MGSGQFGRVMKGLWQSPVGVLPVAVKMLKEGTVESDEVRDSSKKRPSMDSFGIGMW